jgi:KDO2-lipid IV(A) lauroyltransferase
VKGRWARFLLALGEALGSAAWALGLRRRVALDGLRRAFPERTEGERSAIGRAAYRQLGRSLAEVALARRVSDADLDELVRFDNWDLFQSAQARGRGVVVAIAHFGNWELLARATARRGVPLTAITRVLRGRLNEKLLSARREGGLRELPDKGSTGAALQLLRRGETLAVVVDQNMLPSRGVFVDFFGEPACTTPAASVLALRSGAPLIAAFPVRAADGTHRVRLEGPFAPPSGARGRSAVLALTREVTSAVERAVRDHPDHWFWVHRRWKTRPSGSASAGPAPNLPPRRNP